MSFILNKKIFWIFFPLYNDKNMPIVLEDKTVGGTGKFAKSSFTYCYYISRLDFASILVLHFILLPGI